MAPVRELRGGEGHVGCMLGHGVEVVVFFTAGLTGGIGDEGG